MERRLKVTVLRQVSLLQIIDDAMLVEFQFCTDTFLSSSSHDIQHQHKKEEDLGVNIGFLICNL